MGIFLDYADACFTIPPQHKPACLAALQALLYCGEYQTIVEAFEDLGYSAQVCEDTSIRVTYLESEKWSGDDEKMCKIIAPYVEEGGYIQCSSHIDHWKKSFENGECREYGGRIIFDDEEAEFNAMKKELAGMRRALETAQVELSTRISAQMMEGR